MNARENFLSLLRRKGYVYHPVEFNLCPSLIETFNTKTASGLPYERYFKMPWECVSDGIISKADEQIYRKYYNFELKKSTHIDVWGIAHEPGSEAAMHMTYMHHPLKDLTTIEELAAYPYPDYLNADFSHQKAECEAIHAKGLVALGSMQVTIWETAWYLRSMEQLMMDMLTDKEKAAWLIDKVLEASIFRAQQFARAGCDILFFGDDIGMQQSIMMSEEMYLEWFKPRLKRLIDEVKTINPEILIFYHSCGFVTPFIPHLIEAGIDVLNPVQPECMDFEELHRLYGHQLSFHGTIGTQTTMPFGTPEEVKALVKKNLTLAGKKGGLFCTPTHMLEPEVPWENIIAYCEACSEFDPTLL
jgi:uroporphyrinogen decarboxylase